jgi:hypothetical protein
MTNKEYIDERIRELYQIHGRLTPDIVIEDAKNDDSPLHGEFDWNVERAAMEAWREKARQIIRSVTVVVVTESKTFSAHGYKPPQFVRDPSKKNNEQGYISIHVLKNDREKAIESMNREIGIINSCLMRARALCSELGLEKEIRIVSDAMTTLTQKVKKPL